MQMPQVEVKRTGEGAKALPVFDEIAQRFQAIQRRAFELFETRGGQPGQDVEDWLKAERELCGWSAAELAKKDDVFEMQVALPGFEVKEVEVTATPVEIVVRAARQREKKTREGDVLWTEFGSSGIYRRFEFPKPIRVDGVTAQLDNGLLRIHAPELARPKEIAAAKAA